MCIDACLFTAKSSQHESVREKSQGFSGKLESSCAMLLCTRGIIQRKPTVLPLPADVKWGPISQFFDDDKRFCIYKGMRR